MAAIRAIAADSSGKAAAGGIGISGYQFVMKAFAETVAALGTPLLLRALRVGEGRQVLIARWQHGDARVETNAEDAVRVILSLRGGHRVRLGREFQTARTIVAGSLNVLATDRYSVAQIAGQADVVQIFIDPAFLDEVAGAHFRYVPLIDSHDAILQAAVLQLFVGARGGDPDADLLMETSLWRIVDYLIERQMPDRLKQSIGGIACGAMRRVDELVADRLDAADPQAPNIGELAAAARMSSSHFMRAFKQSTGGTPHQYVLARRFERAIELLARPEFSVAEVADSTGYSSPSHFVASFRQRLGVTPGAYRHAVLA